MAMPLVKNRIVSVAGTVALMMVLAACGGESELSPSVTVAYSSPVEAQPSQQDMIQGLKAAAAGIGWTAKIMDANLSPDAQVSNVQTMIQQRVSAIALWTLDAGAMQGSFAQAKSANIPVIGVNSTGENVASTVWWAMNLCGDGAPLKQLAARIAKARPGGKVIVFGGPPVPSIQANVRCFSEAAKVAGLQLVNQTDNVKDTSATAAALASDVLAKYPDVAAVWAYNDASALGVSSAAGTAGMKISDGASAGLIIVGANGDADAIQAIKQGRLTGTIDPNNVACGAATIKAMQDAINGVTGKQYIVDSTYYDASNINTYVAPANQKYDLSKLPVTVQ